MYPSVVLGRMLSSGKADLMEGPDCLLHSVKTDQMRPRTDKKMLMKRTRK